MMSVFVLQSNFNYRPFLLTLAPIAFSEADLGDESISDTERSGPLDNNLRAGTQDIVDSHEQTTVLYTGELRGLDPTHICQHAPYRLRHNSYVLTAIPPRFNKETAVTESYLLSSNNRLNIEAIPHPSIKSQSQSLPLLLQQQWPPHHSRPTSTSQPTHV